MGIGGIAVRLRMQPRAIQHDHASKGVLEKVEITAMIAAKIK